MPTDLDGKTLRPQLKDPAQASSKPARGFWNSGLKTVRTDRWRLIIDPKAKRAELFDYQTDQLETQNHAAKNPARIVELREMMEKS
jgi:arylsulfatase A-like enzyme